MLHTRWSHRNAIAIALAAGVVVACAGDTPTVVDDSPLAGLKTAQANDSAGTPPPAPAPAANPTPGYVRGTVRAPSPNAPPGQDTLTVGTKIAGAIVTAYPRLVQGTDTAGVGPIAAQVTTDADGKFQLPTLPGGEYVITFNPPASLSATYGGVWTVGTIHEKSSEHPWWITLWKK